ncbi:hypothetical protein F5H01DRAFT_340741 [Linnemannia elongata]|nr:hypothetical protein F5H01DRAFT_340741 [Linnemannia elongata]
MLLLILAFLSSFFPPFQSPLACLICSPLARVPNHRHGEGGPSPLSTLRILELVFPNMSHFLFGKGLDTALMYSRAQFVVTRSIQSVIDFVVALHSFRQLTCFLFTLKKIPSPLFFSSFPPSSIGNK